VVKYELCLTDPLLNSKRYTGGILCRPSRLLPDFAKEKVETWKVDNECSSVDDPP
jgi:hypothetical protein